MITEERDRSRKAGHASANRGRDALTLLCAREVLEDAWPRELDRAARAGAVLTLFVFDFDGLECGKDDALLCELGFAFGLATRIADIACRYESRAFVVACPGLDAGIALRRLHEITSQLGAIPLPRVVRMRAAHITFPVVPRRPMSGGGIGLADMVRLARMAREPQA